MYDGDAEWAAGGHRGRGGTVLTLGDVLDQTGIGLELVTGGDRALERNVVGAHSMEVEYPCRWLEPEWILLTIGMRLQGVSTTEQRRLVAEAQDGGLAALGFGVGMVFDTVPEAMLDEARQRRFPIFIVPVESQFRTIVDFVHRALSTEETSALHRSLTLQRYLMGVLSSPQPREDLLTRLTTSLQCDAAIYRYDGRVLVARGSIDFEGVWGAVTAREPREQVFHVDDMQILSFPLLDQGSPTEWLVVVARRATGNPLVTREVSRSAARLLESTTQARRVAVLEERAVGARLLERLIANEVDPADVDRLRAFGFNIADGARVAVVSLMDRGDGDVRTTDRLREAIEQALVNDHVAHLIHVRESDAVVLIGDEEGQVSGIMDGAHAVGLEVRAGVGRPVHRADDLATSAQDAALRVARLERIDAPAGSIADDAQVGLAEWLVQSADLDGLRDRASSVLERLKAHEELFETLQVYLGQNLNVKVTAHALGLHPNSLRYRLTRIEQLLGQRLEEPSTIVEISLALLVDRSAGLHPRA